MDDQNMNPSSEEQTMDTGAEAQEAEQQQSPASETMDTGAEAQEAEQQSPEQAA